MQCYFGGYAADLDQQAMIWIYGCLTHLFCKYLYFILT